MNYQEILMILPAIILGFCVGTANYFQDYARGDREPSFRRFLGNFFTSGMLCFIIFAILDGTGLSFLQKLGISSLVSFLGIEKAIEMAERLLQMAKANK